MIYCSIFNLSSTENSTMTNIVVTNSSVNLFSVGSTIDDITAAKTVTFSNIQYTDSYITTERSLLSSQGVEIDGNFSIIASNFLFDNIEFESHGNLLSLGHQTYGLFSLDTLT